MHWELAKGFTTNIRIGNAQTVMCTEVDAQQETECEQYQTEKSSYVSISIEEAHTEAKQLEKKLIRPTWAATKSLVLSQTPLNQLKANS